MRTALILFLVAAVCTQNQLKYLTVDQGKLSIEDLLIKFTELQSEIYKKVFQNYMLEQISGLRSKGQGQNQVRQRVLQLLAEPKGPLFSQLTQFMQDSLFKKLEIGLLTPSLRAEILQNPENFYLTFDIYDLLFD